MSSVSPRHPPILLFLFPVSLFSSVAFLLQHFCFCISVELPVQRKMDKVYSSDFGSSIVFWNHTVLPNQLSLPPALPGLEPGKRPTRSCIWQPNSMPTEEEFYKSALYPSLRTLESLHFYIYAKMSQPISHILFRVKFKLVFTEVTRIMLCYNCQHAVFMSHVTNVMK